MCNCDAIKFQTFNTNARVSAEVKAANYAEKADGLQENINEMFNRLKIDNKFHNEIFHMQKKKLDIFSTPLMKKVLIIWKNLRLNFIN